MSDNKEGSNLDPRQETTEKKNQKFEPRGGPPTFGIFVDATKTSYLTDNDLRRYLQSIEHLLNEIAGSNTDLVKQIREDSKNNRARITEYLDYWVELEHSWEDILTAQKAKIDQLIQEEKRVLDLIENKQ